MAKTDVAEKLRKACEGLSFPSETDAPIEVLHFPGAADQIESAAFRKLVGASPRKSVETLDVGAFLTPYCTEQPDHDASVRKIVKKFQQLKALLEEHLEDLRVYRIGKIDAAVYIVGATAGGDLVALATRVVET